MGGYDSLLSQGQASLDFRAFSNLGWPYLKSLALIISAKTIILKKVIFWGSRWCFFEGPLFNSLYLGVGMGKPCEFPGSPVVRTPCSHSQDRGSISNQETKILQAAAKQTKRDGQSLDTWWQVREHLPELFLGPLTTLCWQKPILQSGLVRAWTSNLQSDWGCLKT